MVEMESETKFTIHELMLISIKQGGMTLNEKKYLDKRISILEYYKNDIYGNDGVEFTPTTEQSIFIKSVLPILILKNIKKIKKIMKLYHLDIDMKFFEIEKYYT
jgi:hypothetical protein